MHDYETENSHKPLKKNFNETMIKKTKLNYDQGIGSTERCEHRATYCFLKSFIFMSSQYWNSKGKLILHESRS